MQELNVVIVVLQLCCTQMLCTQMLCCYCECSILSSVVLVIIPLSLHLLAFWRFFAVEKSVVDLRC